MLIPVFSLYAQHLTGYTPLLMGIAIGGYGLTQALLQVPLGTLSDHLGRKPVIILGLSVFILGSLIATKAHTITGVIVGRSLQGMGAIGSTLLALLADLIPEDVRTQAMAIVGITIGTVFSAGMVLGPFLYPMIGVKGLFWLTALFGLIGIGMLCLVPTPPQPTHAIKKAITLVQMQALLGNRKLQQANLTIFICFFILTANFVVLPISLQGMKQVLNTSHQGWLYLPTLLMAFGSVPLLIRYLENRNPSVTLRVGMAGLSIAELLFFIGQHLFVFTVLGLYVFFTMLTVLEAFLPTQVTKIAPLANRGTAIGIYSSCQFLGAFAGGAMGGLLYGLSNISTVFITCAFLAFLSIFALNTR